MNSSKMRMTENFPKKEKKNQRNLRAWKKNVLGEAKYNIRKS